MPSDLSLRGPDGAVAISGRQLRFRRERPVIRPSTARLPRRFAPRNDTSGWPGGGNCALHRIRSTFAASRTGAACRSRRPTGDTNRLSTKTYQPIASVAALSERLWQLQISVHYVDRTCLVGGGVLDATLRNATIFAGSLPVIRPGTARLPRAQSALAMTNLFALRH